MQETTLPKKESSELIHLEAKTLPGWTWEQYDDGSGHLSSPKGKSYFQYDLSTHEYRDPGRDGNNWCFFDGYPYETDSFEEFKDRAERWIREHLIEAVGEMASGTKTLSPEFREKAADNQFH